MSEARLEITLGSTKFSGEGSESWLSQELEKFLKELPSTSTSLSSPPIVANQIPDPVPAAEQKSSSNLPIYLQETSSTTNQVRKFLAAAAWIQDRNNAPDINTADITKALRDSRQNRLTNAADCLNKNVAKGLCEKTSTGFFVTGVGRASLAT